MGLATTLLSSTTKTESGATKVVTNVPYKGAYIVADITAVSGVDASITFSLEMLDVASGEYISLAELATGTGVSTKLALIYPTTDAEHPVLPGSYRIAYEITGTTPSFTFSIGANYLL